MFVKCKTWTQYNTVWTIWTLSDTRLCRSHALDVRTCKTSHTRVPEYQLLHWDLLTCLVLKYLARPKNMQIINFRDDASLARAGKWQFCELSQASFKLAPGHRPLSGIVVPCSTKWQSKLNSRGKSCLF